MTDKVNNIYLLRNLNAAYNALTPSDKMLVFMEVTLDTNNIAIPDTSAWLAPGAVIDYWLLNRTDVHKGTASTITTHGNAIAAGQMCVSTTAETIVADTTTGNEIPAASTTCMMAMIVNIRDLLQ